MDILNKIASLEKQAKDFGFYWQDSKTIIQQIRSECAEIEELLENKSNTDSLQEEIGDLLHAAFSLCIYHNYNPQDTLEKSTKKFEKRFNLTKIYAQEDGLKNLKESSPQEMMKYWNKAKL